MSAAGSATLPAAEALNKAALLASDSGLPELAARWCWRQFLVFQQAAPLPAPILKAALQPLVNLGRLASRTGDTDRAYAFFAGLYETASTGGDFTLDQTEIDFRQLADSEDALRAAQRFLWTVLLADATHTLTRAGRWAEALDHVHRHNGVGNRLLDGRQVTILALTELGQPDQAAKLVEASTTIEPWEHTIRHLLRIHCQHAAGADAAPHIPAMLSAVLTLLRVHDPSTASFRTRAGVTALGLAQPYDDPRVSELHTQLINAALGDARATQDALTHLVVAPTTTSARHQDLVEVVRTAGLGAESIPEAARDELLAAVSAAEVRLRTLLDDQRGSGRVIRRTTGATAAGGDRQGTTVVI